MPWQHPTGNSPKTVNLLCLGQSRAVYTDACLAGDLSPALDCDETWTLNRGFGLFPHDLCFVMDNIGGEADKFPVYGSRLWKHTKPIITSDNCEGWPGHVHRFPVDEIWYWLRTVVSPMHGNWFHNSVAYIIVYAAFIGVRELRVFGADYSNHSSGVVEDGHPCVAYWVGKLESVGLTCLAPDQSGFLNVNQRNWIYGYRDDPRSIPAARSRFRALVGLEAPPESTALLSGERQVAESIDAIQPDHRHRYLWAADKVEGVVLDLGAGIGYGSKLMAERPGVEKVVSVDRSKGALEFGELHYAHPGICRIECDLGVQKSAISRFEHTFDWAVAFELIEHLADPKPLLKSIPARRLLASVPNEAVIPYSPETAPYHHRHYTTHQLTGLLESCGWKVVGWYGQTGPDSQVLDGYRYDGYRTLIVEAERCLSHDSFATKVKTGA